MKEAKVMFLKRDVNPKRTPGLAPLVDAFKKAGAKVKENGNSVVVSLNTADPEQKKAYDRYSLGALTAEKPRKPDRREPLFKDECLLPGG